MEYFFQGSRGFFLKGWTFFSFLLSVDQQPIDQRNVKVELVVQRLDNNVLCGDSLRDSHMKEALSHNMIHQNQKKAIWECWYKDAPAIEAIFSFAQVCLEPTLSLA